MADFPGRSSTLLKTCTASKANGISRKLTLPGFQCDLLSGIRHPCLHSFRVIERRRSNRSPVTVLIRIDINDPRQKEAQEGLALKKARLCDPKQSEVVAS